MFKAKWDSHTSVPGVAAQQQSVDGVLANSQRYVTSVSTYTLRTAGILVIIF